VRHRQRDLTVAAANRQMGDFDARLHAGPVRRELADRQLCVELVGHRALDARAEFVDARQQHVAQPEERAARDEVRADRDRQRHLEHATQHRMIVLRSGRFGRCCGGFLTVGHAADGRRYGSFAD
jgi:hypothetical protein